jgi:uncharacterized membrane protein YuzA (DUF378 family)
MLNYLNKNLYVVAIFILVLGGLAFGTIAIFKIDAASALLGKGSLYVRLFAILVTLAAIYIGMSRDSYLPFLGETVMPCSVLSEKIPEHADLKVRVMAPKGHKVLYWAAEPKTDSDKATKNWKDAYGGFNNIGVAIAGEDGSAVLNVRRPQTYWVPPGRRLEPHVHYRICTNNGMLGSVRSLFIEEQVEGFGIVFHL